MINEVNVSVCVGWMSREFSTWATQNGIKTDSTYIHENPKMGGRCLRASRSIKKGEKILFCPPKFIINNQFIIGQTQIGKYLMQYPQELDPMQLMMAFLIIEFDKGAQSDFKHFVQSLPKKFSLPVVWRKEVGQLLPTEMITKYSDFCDYVDVCSRKLERVACEYTLDITAADIMWAFCCVNTRCFYVAEHLNPLLDCSRIKNNMVLIPYLDMCNHSPDVSTDYDVNVDGCDIFATSDIEKDAEIFLHYGAHNNYVLLIEYGFISHNNSHDCVIFTKEDLLSSLKSYSDKMRPSNEFEKLCGKELFFIQDAEPSWTLITMLAALKTNDFDYFLGQYFGGELEFPKQPILLRKVLDFKRKQYEEQLEQLKDLKRTSDDDRFHCEVLKSLLQSRILILKSVQFKAR